MQTTDQSGFTLAEVLVSVFILSLGVIGTIGMQLATLRTTQQTAFQTTAVQLASEIADTLRGYRNDADQADDANPYLGLDYSSLKDPMPSGAEACHARDCNSEEFAHARIAEWKNRVRDSLPGGRLRICRDIAPWHPGTGAFTWDCTGAGDPATAPLAIKIGWVGKSWSPDAGKPRSAGLVKPPDMTMLVAFDAR